MLVGYNLLLRDFELYVIICMNVRVVITVAMTMLLRDLGALWQYVFTTLDFPVVFDGLFTGANGMKIIVDTQNNFLNIDSF
jgi:hypothetical protein